MQATIAAAALVATLLIGVAKAPPVPVAIGTIAACGLLWWRTAKGGSQR